MIVCWTVKGGSGTSVVSALLANALVAYRPTTLIDLDGDQPSILGATVESHMGIRQWLDAGSGVLSEALSRLSVEVRQGLTLLPAGQYADFSTFGDPREQAERLADAQPDAVVDAGLVRSATGLPAALAQEATLSILVVRPCYLAIRRASELNVKPAGIIVVDEPERSLDARDIADVLGAPILATVPWEAKLARAVDAGRLPTKHSRAVKNIEKLVKSIEEQRDDV